VLTLSYISCVIILQDGRTPMDLAVANDLNCSMHYNECILCKNVLNPTVKDAVTPGHCTLPKLAVCCLCAVDLGYKGSMCDGCKQCWNHLKALESKVSDENEVSAGAPGPVFFHDFFQEITSTRALVGRSLQYRLDLIVVNILLQTSDGVDLLVRLICEQGVRLQAECKRSRFNTKQIVSENCDIDLSVSDLEREAARREKKEGLPVKFSRSVIPACLRMRSVAKAAGLVALVPNGKLRALIVSHNTNLNRLPVDELLEIKSLTSIECRGCSRLYCPPPEIAELEGVEVVNYLKSARVDGILNTDFEMITIGNGEAGKTSVIRAMMKGTSEKIHEDKRTVGIDLKTWDLTKEEGLIFHIKDLAGRAVYTLTNHFFLVRRAIYLLVWRVDKGKSSSHDTELWEKQISDMVLTWMESLQLRVPGASILLVVTHIDCVSQKELDRQTNFVKKLVLSKLQDLGDDDDDSSVVPLTVWNEGRSMPVNCLLGQGVPELRQEVQSTVEFLKSSFMLLVHLSF
jgi:GTPase SAR1 family protein